MAIFSGPEIPNNGLVFYYDMGNTVKSWKGKPTTNLANVGLSGMSGVSLSFIGVEDGWKKYSMSGTFTGGTYPYVLNITSVSFTGGVTYSSVCYVKTNVLSKFNYFGAGMNYVNEPMNKGGTSLSVTQLDGSFYIGRINFEYTSTTSQTGYILSNPINNTTFNSSTDFVWIKEGQIELGEFPTPFAGDAGTRSNTQAILDLTGNNIITASGLAYSSNNTFSFPGNNSLSIPAIDFSQAQTVEIWLQPLENDATRRNPYNQAYGGYGTWTHEPSGEFNYYYGDAGSNNTPYIGHTSGFTVVQNEIAHIVSTRNTTESRWYKNGIASTVYSHGYGTLTTDTNPILIGTGYSASYIGNIFSVKLYNRALSAAEVQQNFEATRGRYGI